LKRRRGIVGNYDCSVMPANEHDLNMSAPVRRIKEVRRAILVTVILAGVLLRAFIFANLPHDLTVCSTDFSALYAGGRLAGSPGLYSPPVVFATEKQAAGCTMENLVFIRPPFYALLMWPVSRLSFASAFLLWRIATLTAVVAFIALWPGDALLATAACAWSLPLAATFTVGQDVSFLLAALIAAYCLLRSNRPLAAGVAIGLCAIKFHLFLLVPLLLIRRRMWRTMAGAASVALGFFLASFVVGGPLWIRTWRAALQDTRLNPYPWNMVNLVGLFHSDMLWIVPVSLTVAALCWYFIVRSPIGISLPVTIAGGVLITPHNTVCDGFLFLPALLLALHSQMPAVRALALFALTPIYVFLPHGALQVILLALLAMGAWDVSRTRQRGSGGVPHFQ
jgi:hypothetical protein